MLINYFKVIPKQRPFPRNSDIYADLDKKPFLKIISKDVLFVDMLIFSKIWAKSNFKKWSKKHVLLWYFRMYGEKTSFSKWCQKTSFFTKCCYSCAKNNFCKMISKNVLYAEMLLFIYLLIVKQRYCSYRLIQKT